MVCMWLLTGVVVAYVRYGRGGRFNFLPHTWNRRYTFFTSLFLLLLTLSPSNFTQGLPAVGVLLYGSVVTPLYALRLARKSRLVGYRSRGAKVCFAASAYLYYAEFRK